MASVHQLKVTLRDIRPPVWRRIQLPSAATLAQLHEVIQISFGWYDTHMHQFEAGGVCYGRPDPADCFDVADEERMTLRRLAPKPGGSFEYQYDFGDCWEHRVLVEKILDVSPGLRQAVCIGGRRACPPEDCGGWWGYQEFRHAISDPGHPEHEELLGWVGGEFDPEEFSAAAVTKDLGQLPVGSREGRGPVAEAGER